ncbi:carbamoyl-phosphate synthase large subunit [Candidatus Roizmanbacteria bacterium CG06_land_8_20_14_3_00_34_14]|uniref:Carbamoyl phosphate synthase pyrimidine-specific large chain n=2 Tax=Candidatus Roizmaniibacteriota TaxID=1752723 RepID=A0A2M7AUC5_9BACT|nr:MAG: carbamoyl-phosphate synthase large subunit [Candidatus Roizmanbacteria bacterium CG06_land_8_20_14_3_00_34_14]
MKKILILGSGALKIGQAGEFDYSGSQAIKAFKEEKIETILINSNIATIQTSKELADKVYFLPVTTEFVERVIEKEKPDAIVLSFGGQTALNCGMELYKKGILKKYNVQVLGTPVSAIDLTEDREKFANHLRKIGISTPKSFAVTTIETGLKKAIEIGYPVMVRTGFSLGGQKSGVVENEKEFFSLAKEALAFSPQILVEKYFHHYKEIEYEVVRDLYDNCVTVCNMENFDPLGVHTGESIVVAPSQTLTNFEYHHLRQLSIKIVRSLGIVGECNVQFALNPNPKSENRNPKQTQNSNDKNSNRFDHSKFENSRIVSNFELRASNLDDHPVEYYVIEVNARLSRSSALASKATGYPLAYVAAKLILGKSLMEIKNQVTQIIQSFFEPALDYIVVKIPRWDMDKFKGTSEKIGSSMKSVGEIMAIGRTFEEAIQKGVRMLDIGVLGVTDNNFNLTTDEILAKIKQANSKRIFFITKALKLGITVQKIYELSGIDPWFLYRLQEIVKAEKEIVSVENKNFCSLQPEQLLRLKQLGFSDKKIGELIGKTEFEIRKLRNKWKLKPSIFQIDTMAGEFPAKTNYLYTTYNGGHHDVAPIGDKGVMVLGSGPYRIGSSVEFDWTCVNTALNLKKYGKKSIIINCNPETVSTDYDISDRLYFEEISFERVADIYEFENPSSVILSVGGQTPSNISKKIDKYGIKIIGTTATDIDKAEDRKKFSQLLDDLKIKQPVWNSFTEMEVALKFARDVGYPILVRPSYVLSGAAMSLCYNPIELKHFIEKASNINKKYPVTISKYMTNAREIEFDAVAEKGVVKVFAISNHIEHAGVHSGDATIVYPAERVRFFSGERMIEIARQLSKSLNITGPFNIQFMVKDNEVFVIELNLRASRTFPFISKVTGVNFAEVIVDSFFDKAKEQRIKYPNYVAVKAPQFSFARMEGADPALGVEMGSTGEVACFGDTAEEAYLKSLISTGLSLKNKSALISIGGDDFKLRFSESIWRLKNLGYTLYATKKTHLFLKTKGVRTKLVHKLYDKQSPTVIDLIEKRIVSLVINLSEDYNNEGSFKRVITDGYRIRRASIDNNIPLFTDLNSARFFVNALDRYNPPAGGKDLKIKSWDEYL